MAEVIDLGAVNRDLRIEIEPGIGCAMEPPRPETEVYIKPPLTEDEHATLIEAEEPDSEITEWLTAATEKVGVSLQLNLDGSAPREAHVSTAIDLAEKIMVLRGIRAAKVVSCIDGILSEKLVLDDTRPDDTVIDADEFEEARNDPRWQAFMQEAQEYVDGIDKRDREKENEGNVHVVEATERSAVLRSPVTGNLYGIAMDQLAGEEVVNVTPLAEPEAKQ